MRGAGTENTPKNVAREATAVVLAVLPSDLYRVKCEDGRLVTVSLGGVARQTTVRVIAGDTVAIEFSPEDPTRGRIKNKLTVRVR